MKAKNNIFKGKVVIVTGGTGSIGSGIVEELLRHDVAQVRIYSRDEHKQHELRHRFNSDRRLRYMIGDIRDKERTDFAFNGAHICFHTAAMKHVPACEYNPFEAVKTNVIGTQNVIDVSIKNNLERVIGISSDKAADPSSVLGASKLMMEKLITAANLIKGSRNIKFSSVRLGNITNSRGSVIPLWIEQIKLGKPVTITDKKMKRYFMDIDKVVKFVIKAAEVMDGGEIFVPKMEETNIYTLVKNIISEHGNGKKIPIKVIGIRPGEKMREKLITDEEVPFVKETKDMFIISSKLIYEN